jgi:hypothetical protein
MFLYETEGYLLSLTDQKKIEKHCWKCWELLIWNVSVWHWFSLTFTNWPQKRLEKTTVNADNYKF